MIKKEYLHRWFYFTALLFAFLLPLSRAGLNLFSLMLLLIWIIEGDFKKKFTLLKKEPFIQALVLFILYAFLNFLWIEPQNFKEALSYDFKYIYFLIIPILYTSYDSQKYRDLLYAFLAGMAISSLQSLSIYFHIYNFHEVNIESLSPHMWHTIYSIFLAFSGLTALILAMEKNHFITKILFISLTIMITTVLFLGISRTGQAIYIFGLLSILISLFRVRLSILISSLLIITFLLLTLYQLNPRFKARINVAQQDITLLTQQGNYCSSLGGRLYTWKVAYEVFQKEPLLGMGTIDHLHYLKNSMNQDEKFSTCGIKELISYYHAQYIEQLAQSGIIGLLLLLYLFYTFNKIETKDETLRSIKYLFSMVFLLAFFLDVPFRKMFTLGLFALISSIILLEKKQHAI